MTDVIVKVSQAMLDAMTEANPEVELEQVDLDGISANIKKKYEAKGAKKLADTEATLTAQLADLQAELEEAREIAEGTGKKATDAEKLIKANEKLTAKLEEQRGLAEKAQADATGLKRRQSIDRITREQGLRSAEGIDPAIWDMAVQNSFADLDGDDLQDADSVGAAVSSFRDRNKGMILADSAGGTGVKTTEKSPAGKLTMEAWKSLPFAEQQARRAEVLNQ